MTLHIPDALRDNAAQVWGERGRHWIDALPALVEACATRWSLDVGTPFELSYHWVAPARAREGGEAVLKLGVPGEPHLAREAAVLDRFAGCGAVRLLDADPGRGALLLERAVPGTTATDLVPHDDETATRALAGVARSLHRTDPTGLDLRDIASVTTSLDQHVATYGSHDPLPLAMVEQARDLLVDLTASRSQVVVLHGDLHHDNVLRHDSGGDEATEGWVAIDPHGWLGDPGFEVGPLLYNPIGSEPELLVRLLPRRLEVLADALDQQPDRVRAWGFVAAVVSQVWRCQDGGSPDPAPGAVAVALRPR